MPEPAIRAILWDFGGVFTSSPFEAFARYEREQGLPADFIRRVNARNPDDNAWAKLERSEVDLDTFCRLFEAETQAHGHRVPGRDVLALLAGDVRPQMVAAQRRIRGRFHTACLTNNVRHGSGPAMADNPRRAAEVAEVMALFDHVLESSKIGARKPEPRVYRIALEHLRSAPEETVFLDDLGINLKPARALGLHTIKVSSAEQALRELEPLLGIALR
ncbi:MAG: HAD-IA family hydrolase [Alphaproteobacteria bacterium]|nr:HAD-IA family hydrolase [Alphaproteobacteria bacterium]